MKYKVLKGSSFAVVELWVFTAIFILVSIFIISPAFDMQPPAGNPQFEAVGAPFNYYQNELLPLVIRYSVLFAAFVVMNSILLPRIIRGEKVVINVAWAIVVLIGVFMAVYFTNYYLKYYLFYASFTERGAVIRLLQLSFLYTFRLLLIFAAYTMVRYAGLILFQRFKERGFKSRYLSREMLFIIPLWIIIIIFLASSNVPELLCLWLFAVPCAVLLYYYSFRSLIPLALRKKKPFLFFMLRALLLCFAAFLVVAFLLVGILDNEEMGFGVALFNGFLQFFVVMPGLWVLFRRQMSGNEELYALKSELGRSAASLDFLRSQINPHFLFNALNTIYGTAIQEGAERTSEGVEKLGDMMRFMLLENMQEKIALTRELEYLNNYISLQRLRTDTTPGIRIQVDVQQEISPMVQIAPMLLIPFVENAFKHGISLREESYIKLSLELKDTTLYFDVFNSKHQRPQHDPEKHNNGIGLANVKQRLQLLYPGKHELVIRETAKDFFVHLIINLGK